MPNRAQQIFKPEFRFGLGGVSLGNEFNKHTDKEAERTLEAAWDVGVRYFDVAPWYGFGLAERRFGHFLHNKKRDDYLLSSKVGKLFKASKNNRHADIYPLSDSPNDIVFDYTADGVRRSIEDSLQRLGVDSLAGFSNIAGDFVCAGCAAINNTNIANTTFSAGDKLFHVFWTGAKYPVTDNLDLIGANSNICLRVSQQSCPDAGIGANAAA
jgi:aryl-alcohol dehydrogenase-like predicted oxidoreductase